MTATDRQRIECRSIAILSDCGIERPHLVGLRRPAKVGGMTAYGAQLTLSESRLNDGFAPKAVRYLLRTEPAGSTRS
jgi:hypothetical protein